MKRIFCLCLVVIAAFCVTQTVYAAAPTGELTDADCVKCHIKEVKDIDANGAAHKEMGCTDCHAEHAPTGTDIIPKCALCHDASDNKHFGLANCSGCHNPHHPLNIDFSALDNVKPACLTCHADKGEEMAAHPSAHSEQDCNSCHNAHGLDKGQFSNCLDCHDGHSADMVVADCTKCHKPHSPKEVTYSEIPSKLCAGCHGDIVTTLAKSKTKHSEMACSECHVDKHMTITPCEDCHDLPHSPAMHKKYPKCIQCHVDPHALVK